jgi:excisionase family DNA binding protein
MRKRQTTPIAAPIDVSQLQLLAIPEVAQLLSIGRTSVYDLINTKELETVKIGISGRVRIPAISLHQYIERQKQVS